MPKKKEIVSNAKQLTIFPDLKVEKKFLIFYFDRYEDYVKMVKMFGTGSGANLPKKPTMKRPKMDTEKFVAWLREQISKDPAGELQLDYANLSDYDLMLAILQDHGKVYRKHPQMNTNKLMEMIRQAEKADETAGEEAKL